MPDYEIFCPYFTHYDGSVTNAGEEIFVRGIGNKPLGIGRFAGSIVLTEQGGSKVSYPVLKVQEQYLLGGEVDLWTTDQELIDAHRCGDWYPAILYAIEERTARTGIQSMAHQALAELMGVQLD